MVSQWQRRACHASNCHAAAVPRLSLTEEKFTVWADGSQIRRHHTSSGVCSAGRSVSSQLSVYPIFLPSRRHSGSLAEAAVSVLSWWLPTGSEAQTSGLLKPA